MLARMNNVVASRNRFLISVTIDAVTMPFAWSVSLMSAVTSNPVRVRWKKPRSSSHQVLVQLAAQARDQPLLHAGC